jgi:hypothetical protein
MYNSVRKYLQYLRYLWNIRPKIRRYYSIFAPRPKNAKIRKIRLFFQGVLTPTTTTKHLANTVNTGELAQKSRVAHSVAHVFDGGDKQDG